MGAQDSSEQPTKEKPVKIQPEEKIIGEAKAHSFKAETQKLLQIVANSLYSEKEVCFRRINYNLNLNRYFAENWSRMLLMLWRNYDTKEWLMHLN